MYMNSGQIGLFALELLAIERWKSLQRLIVGKYCKHNGGFELVHDIAYVV